jgi:NADPH-dependent F420 reductase
VSVFLASNPIVALSLYSGALSDSSTDPVCVIGASGALGFGLALRLAKAGSEVIIGSRDTERASETVARAQQQVPDGSFSGYENGRAAGEAGIVILSVPFRNQSETLTNLKGKLSSGTLLIDATVPLAAAVSGKATRMLGVWQGSAAQQAQEMAGDGVHVVSALHTVSAASLSDLDHELSEDVLICGDSRDHKRRAAQLIERIDGLRCVDCGRLEMARITESLTALLISINIRHKTHAGIQISGLPEQRWG